MASRAAPELALQRLDEDAHHVRTGVLALVPDPALQRVERHHPSRVEREHAQQLVLGRSEVDRLAPDRHPALRVVDQTVSQTKVCDTVA